MAKQFNPWKIISIMFIILFCIIVLLGAVRIYKFKTSFPFGEASGEQISTARDIIEQELKQQNENIEEYKLDISRRIQKIRVNETEKKLIQVSAAKDSIKQTFLIDTESKEIVMYSSTRFYGWMIDHDKQQYRSRGKPELLQDGINRKRKS